MLLQYVGFYEAIEPGVQTPAVINKGHRSAQKAQQAAKAAKAAIAH